MVRPALADEAVADEIVLQALLFGENRSVVSQLVEDGRLGEGIGDR
jgi:hypothetical protein